MTIEERFDKLLERHEALTQTVEVIAGMQRASEANIDKILAAQDRDGEHIRALARIAEIHERRITDLEGGEVNG